MDAASRLGKIDFLVRRKFAIAMVPIKSKSLSHNVGPDTSVIEEKKKYEASLHALPDEEIVRLHNETLRSDVASREAQKQKDEQSRFFNRPEASAQVEHWARAATWTLDEAVALSLGKDPDKVTWARVEPLQHVSAFAASYKSRRQLVLRAKSARQLFDPAYPSFFISWAKRMEIAFPQDLEERVTHFSGAMMDWKDLYEKAKAQHSRMLDELQEAMRAQQQKFKEECDKLLAESKRVGESVSARIEELTSALQKAQDEIVSLQKQKLGGKERESLLKLVYGMAVDGYGYNPNAGRSGIATEISGHLATLGISLDADTVRKYLGEAKEALADQLSRTE